MRLEVDLMRTDLRYKITLASVIALSLLLLSFIAAFLMFTSTVWLGLIPIYLFMGAFLVTLILSYVPFMRDHMWLSITCSAVLCGVAGLIMYLVI